MRFEVAETGMRFSGYWWGVSATLIELPCSEQHFGKTISAGPVCPIQHPQFLSIFLAGTISRGLHTIKFYFLLVLFNFDIGEYRPRRKYWFSDIERNRSVDMARNMNFQQIEAFKAVMQMGTATGAALMLNTTQPSISRRISELQNATELKLFDLHHGRLRPTSEGRLLYKTIQQHYDALQKIESVVAVMRRSGTQTLRLGCTPTLGIGLIPSIIHRFLHKFPNTHITIQTLSTQQLGSFLHQDLIDLALTTGTLNEDDFRPETIHKTQAVCVLPLGHRLRDMDTIEFTMLKGEHIFSISETDELSIKIKAQLLKYGLANDFTVHTPSSITVCALVAAGSGVGIVTPYVAGTFSSQLLIKPLSTSIDIYVQMAMPTHTAPSLLTRQFISILMDEIRINNPINKVA